MAEAVPMDMEEVVREKVEEELKTMSISKRKDMTKRAKDIIDTLLSEIAKVITISVTAAMTTAMDKIIEAVQSQAVDSFLLLQALLMKYECDRLEQYQRRDNLRIYGIEEESEESEETLEEKVVELAANMGVILQTDDISVVHRVGKLRDRERPVILQSCRRKKRNAFLCKKGELKTKDIRVFANEDLTPLRSAMR